MFSYYPYNLSNSAPYRCFFSWPRLEHYQSIAKGEKEYKEKNCTYDSNIIKVWQEKMSTILNAQFSLNKEKYNWKSYVVFA